MTTPSAAIEQLAINAIRALSIDMIEQANSGHPGLPMGAAPMAYELWTKHMKHSPQNPKWFDRDRFILSAGHGSALLYSLLHLTGYDLPIAELKRFRQWGSQTPGHPEYGHTVGVEATTGPLGQGIAMAVGMAMAEAHLAATYNQDGYDIIDHYTYALCGDGDLMEGVSAEAASMAGHMKLGKLIVLYDSNDISLDGELSRSFTEDVMQRFQAYGWQTIRVEDGNDIADIGQAIMAAKQEKERPTLIEVRTVIGYGSPNKAGSAKAHGAPLGEEEVKLTKQNYGWTYEAFEIPQEVTDHFSTMMEEGANQEVAWHALFESYQQAYPELAKQLIAAIKNELPAGWDQDLPSYEPGSHNMATRASSGIALNALATNLPTLFGGSADLASSNYTTLNDLPIFSADDYAGRNVWFGVREFAMGAALNGLALHGGIRPYGGTFFVFSDYLKAAIRLSALMKQPVLYVLTHDSIAVGEDGPTHEPVEQLPALRAIPDLITFRPADANETMACYRYALQQRELPVAMVLSRQALPVLEGTKENAHDGVTRGAYVLSDPADGQKPRVILLATGSEVSLAMEAKQALQQKGIPGRVVSMPSWELFEKQSQQYKDEVIMPDVKARVAIEMASPLGWERYAGDAGQIIGINQFGYSAPGETIIQALGFTVDHVVEKAERAIHEANQ